MSIFHVLRSEVFFSRGEYFDAEDAALKAIDICPDLFPRAYYFIGYIAYNRNNYTRAYQYLKRAIDLNILDPYYSNAIMLYKDSSMINLSLMLR